MKKENSALSDTKARNLVLKAFEYLRCKKMKDLNDLLKELEVDDINKKKEKTYPKIDFEISEEEIKKLIREKYLDCDYLPSNIKRADAFTKLLYAMLWKNGDLKKLKHIVEGIVNPTEEKNDALVFFQFGKYLTKKSNEPIIDQHVLRAFGIYRFKNDSKMIKQFRKMSGVGKSHKKLISEYSKWLKSKSLIHGSKGSQFYDYADSVLYAVGKKVKLHKSKDTSKNS